MAFPALLAAVLMSQTTNVTGVVTFERDGLPFYFMQDDSGVNWRVSRPESPEAAVGDRITVTGEREQSVKHRNPDVDPIGACVGPKGGRVAAVVNELKGEKIDIIKYSEDPVQFVAEALSPSDVISVQMLEDNKSCVVVVPDNQLSLAIGKEGQNARLAAKLTGFKIDIKPESAVN